MAAAGGSSACSPARRLLVVSHPAVVGVNQEPYAELARRGWEVTIALPRSWRHEFAHGDVIPRPLPGLESALRPVRVLGRGRPQRHLYVARVRALARRARPAVAFIEADPFALAAAQWGFALSRLRIPFGVQCAENIDRALPWPVRRLRRRVLVQAAFVAARSHSAAELARSWGARGEVRFVPHAIPRWAAEAAAAAPDPARRSTFAIGYAGRLAESKGLLDLLAAVRLLDAPLELLLVGDGALRRQLEGAPIPGSHVRVLSGLRHEDMARAYGQLDVLVLPSRTTPSWKEQFGRVIVEALSCGVPVVGSDSGEIPWLIEMTGGGLVFPEGDPAALAGTLARLRDEPALRRSLAATGRQAVQRLFTLAAATDALEALLLAAGRPRLRRTAGA